MCGLIGILDYCANGIIKSDIQRFQELMHLNQLRGHDSVGVMAVNGQKLKWIKSLGTPHKLFNNAEWDIFTAMNAFGSNALLGHCRAATRGTLTAENAHPFTVGNITLIKNGTISQVADPNFFDWPVDSMWAADCLDKHGPQEFINKVGAGGFAMIWYDKRDKRLHVMRNEDRPLYKVTMKGKVLDQIWLASEPAMCKFVGDRWDLSHSKVEYFAPYKEYSITTFGAFDMELTEHKKRPVPKSIHLPTAPVKVVAGPPTAKPDIHKIQNYTINGINFHIGKIIKFVPLTWEKMNTQPNKTGQYFTRYTGFLSNDLESLVELSGVADIDEKIITECTEITAKVTTIRRDQATQEVKVSCGNPFFTCGAE